MSLSVSTAWNETAAFARREARLLFPIAFLLLSLPAAILQAMAPVTAPGRLPEPGLWLLFVPAVLASSLIGALAISRLALRPGEGAGAALTAGLRTLLRLLGAVLLVGFAGAMLTMAAVLLAAIIAAPVFSASSAIALLALILFFWVRLMLLTPAAAVEPLGPAQLIMRSWALTAGNFWRLLGFLLVAAIVSLVALMAAGAVGGIAVRLAVGQPQPGTLAMVLVFLVSALLQAAISGLFTAFVARLYAQMADERPAG
jgi:hypothetical protein